MGLWIRGGAPGGAGVLVDGGAEWDGRGAEGEGQMTVAAHLAWEKRMCCLSRASLLPIRGLQIARGKRGRGVARDGWRCCSCD